VRWDSLGQLRATEHGWGKRFVEQQGLASELQQRAKSLYFLPPGEALSVQTDLLVTEEVW